MSTFPFQPQFSWRKLGYQFYSNSLDYRAVLEENPQWSVVELPPVGAQISVSDTTTTRGNLLQASFFISSESKGTLDSIYPFKTVKDYQDSLVRYSLQGIILRDSLNGYSFDSDIAITGVK